MISAGAAVSGSRLEPCGPAAPIRMPVAVMTRGSAVAVELVVEISGDLSEPGWAARVLGAEVGRVTGGDELVLVLLAGAQAGEVALGRLHEHDAELVVSGRTGFAG